MMKKLKQTLAWAALGLAALTYGLPAAEAAPLCQILYAGKTANAGSVCVDNDTEFLTVTYATTGDWWLDDLHLFVGTSLSQMPQTSVGNPKIGLFPYTVEDERSQQYTFRIPLGDFKPWACGTTLYVAAHAALVRRDAGGNAYQTETGWANGTRLTTKGSWAMYFTYAIQCPTTLACETAFALGDVTFIQLGITDSRWGWQITVPSNTSSTRKLYAGAAQNDVTKGTYVGDLSYSYSGSVLNVNYQMFPGSTLKKTHVYADESPLSTIAPGKYGNQHTLTNASSDSYTLNVAGNPIYVVAHAEVCTVK